MVAVAVGEMRGAVEWTWRTLITRRHRSTAGWTCWYTALIHAVRRIEAV